MEYVYCFVFAAEILQDKLLNVAGGRIGNHVLGAVKGVLLSGGSCYLHRVIRMILMPITTSTDNLDFAFLLNDTLGDSYSCLGLFELAGQSSVSLSLADISKGIVMFGGHCSYSFNLNSALLCLFLPGQWCLPWSAAAMLDAKSPTSLSLRNTVQGHLLFIMLLSGSYYTYSALLVTDKLFGLLPWSTSLFLLRADGAHWLSLITVIQGVLLQPVDEELIPFCCWTLVDIQWISSATAVVNRDSSPTYCVEVFTVGSGVKLTKEILLMLALEGDCYWVSLPTCFHY
jgi:hypothetical protein